MRRSSTPVAALLASFVCLAYSASAVAGQPANSATDASQELIVTFKSSASSSTEQQAVDNAGATIESRSSLIDGALVRIDPGQSRSDVEANLEDSTAVRYAEPNYTVTSLSTPNDPYFSSQWDLSAINVPQALDLVKTNNAAVVAVTDTGLNFTHPDLSSHLWTNNAEIPNNGIDDDHNGVVDDLHGADFYNYDGDPTDDNGHGTHVSGVIGARTNNSQGIAAVGPNNFIMAIKFLSSGGSGSTWGAIQSINYAVAQNARVINASWGSTSYSQSLRNAIRNADSHGALFVAAAGNSGSNNDSRPFYPASYDEPNVISVAATDQSDGLAYFSNYGSQSVDIAAPGTNIFSTYPSSSYAFLSGTSMAAPHVAGAAALISAEYPTMGASQIKSVLLSSVDHLPSLNGKVSSNGMLDVAAALQAVSPGSGPSPPDTPGSPSPDTPTTTSPSQPNPSAEPARDFPGAFTLKSPRANSKTNGKVRSKTRSRRRPKSLTFKWTDSQSSSGIAYYHVYVDSRIQMVVKDPDGRGDPAAPANKARFPVEAGKHSWYVVAVNWSGRSRLNTYANGSAKHYFTVR